MPIYKGSTKLGTVYHGGTKIEKVYKGSTLVYSGKEKKLIVKYTNNRLNYRGFISGINYKSNQICIGGNNYPGIYYIGVKIKAISDTSLTVDGLSTLNAKTIEYIGELPFVAWFWANTQRFSRGYVLLTAPNAQVGDYALEGNMSTTSGGGDIVDSDNGSVVSTTGYNWQGGVFKSSSFNKSDSNAEFTYLYRG